MAAKKSNLSSDVTFFVKSLSHPLENEINELREIILSANNAITENIKWNGPNFCVDGEDRITMRVHPPKQIQLIFHRGAKTQALPKTKLIDDETKLLSWRTNDRAIVTFINKADIAAKQSALQTIINKWVIAAG